MSVNASKVAFLLDAEPSVRLRRDGLGAESGNGYSGTQSVQWRRSSAYWNDGSALEGDLLISGEVRSINPSGTYHIEVASSATAGGARTTIASVEVSELGGWSVSVPASAIPADHDFIAVGVRISGGGSIDYTAQLRRVSGM